MNISLPASLKAYVDSQAKARGYGSSSEYIRDLVRRDKDRSRLRQLLLEGAQSPIFGTADAEYFKGLKRLARGHQAE